MASGMARIGRRQCGTGGWALWVGSSSVISGRITASGVQETWQWPWLCPDGPCDLGQAVSPPAPVAFYPEGSRLLPGTELRIK